MTKEETNHAKSQHIVSCAERVNLESAQLKKENILDTNCLVHLTRDYESHNKSIETFTQQV
jgi:hypothetical protein